MNKTFLEQVHLNGDGTKYSVCGRAKRSCGINEEFL